jgi:hypothetical protein
MLTERTIAGRRLRNVFGTSRAVYRNLPGTDHLRDSSTNLGVGTAACSHRSRSSWSPATWATDMANEAEETTFVSLAACTFGRTNGDALYAHEAQVARFFAELSREADSIASMQTTSGCQDPLGDVSLREGSLTTAPTSSGRFPVR